MAAEMSSFPTPASWALYFYTLLFLKTWTEGIFRLSELKHPAYSECVIWDTSRLTLSLSSLVFLSLCFLSALSEKADRVFRRPAPPRTLCTRTGTRWDPQAPPTYTPVGRRFRPQPDQFPSSYSPFRRTDEEIAGCSVATCWLFAEAVLCISNGTLLTPFMLEKTVSLFARVKVRGRKLLSNFAFCTLFVCVSSSQTFLRVRANRQTRLGGTEMIFLWNALYTFTLCYIRNTHTHRHTL